MAWLRVVFGYFFIWNGIQNSRGIKPRYGWDRKFKGPWSSPFTFHIKEKEWAFLVNPLSAEVPLGEGDNAELWKFSRFLKIWISSEAAWWNDQELDFRAKPCSWLVQSWGRSHFLGPVWVQLPDQGATPWWFTDRSVVRLKLGSTEGISPGSGHISRASLIANVMISLL